MSKRLNVTQVALRKVFGDLEVIDAKTPLQVFPTNEDFAAGVARDPYNCGFKRCVSAITHSEAAVVFKEFSYFDHVCEDGVRRIVRYQNSRAVQREIVKFDKGLKLDLCRPFVFLPVSPSLGLERRKKRNRRWVASERGKVMLAAWHSNKKLNTAKIDLEKARTRLQNAEVKSSPTSKSVVTAKKEVDRIRKRVGELREIATTANQAASEIRQVPFKSKIVTAAVHKTSNLRVRNGAGFASHIRVAASA